MRHIRIIHRLRTFVALLGFLALLAGIGTLWWANHTGLPDAWRTEIEHALARQGLHTEVASLRFVPLRGIEASEVVIFSDESHQRVIARLHHLTFDVDKSRLSGGDLRIDRLDLTGARISFAADPEDPRSRAIEITEARGRVQVSESRKLEIHEASGMVGGVRIEVEAELLNHRPGLRQELEDFERQRAERRRLVNSTLRILDQWSPRDSGGDGDGEPPRIRIDVTADLEDPSTTRARIRIRGNDFQSADLPVGELSIDAELRGASLIVQDAQLRALCGEAAGRAEYDLESQSGRFELRSILDPWPLLAALRLPEPPEKPSFGAPPEFDLRGQFARKDETWSHRIIGHARLPQPEFHDLSADLLETSFSWDGPRLFLEDLHLQRGGHRLDGRIFITPERIRYQAETDLPVDFWQQAVGIQPLSDILDDFKATDDTKVTVRCHGHANPDDPLDWHFAGDAEGAQLSFRGVPARHARVTMDLDHAKLDFTDGEVEFDYRRYPLRKAHDGPASGKLQVARIRYDAPPSTVTIEGLRGRAWPAPIVRTFAPEVADKLEIYGFHRTPDLEAAGVVGIERGLPLQNLSVRFATTAAADYEFLDAGLTLAAPSGAVRVLPDRVRVSKLAFGLFGGLVRADLEAETRDGGEIEGEVDWTNLSLPALAETYEFGSRPKGRVTGRTDFKLRGEDVTGFSGDGHLALTDGELFDVPVFGPLSPVIAAVLGRKKAGFQEARDAFFTFEIEKGVLSTTDFLTTTSSLVFTGDGVADLNRKTLDMTIRMNARGFLGIITLPLRPFYGLFQFRGRGPIENPEWDNVAFTSPPDQQKKVLLEPPKARAVPVPVEEPPKARPVLPGRRR